ncbi:PREDICTED: protein FAM19A5 isoform X1 [Rhinopithecus bieti]|uniref:protein FAM19A5 isoform X1 n=1 Tax=Rhinopithecus bieti TaxID=61621 RepID=UPI00083BCD51|nr:PREDICTED: protein FAM19A5 isoform X1 [Rhinopithecus bieti]
MAPSPRTGSRQDATALPSMSSTFWAFMILASLLIAYCSQLAAGTCEIVTLDRDSSQPRRTIARQTARCACRKGQIAGTTRARPACVDGLGCRVDHLRLGIKRRAQADLSPSSSPASHLDSFTRLTSGLLHTPHIWTPLHPPHIWFLPQLFARLTSGLLHTPHIWTPSHASHLDSFTRLTSGLLFTLLTSGLLFACLTSGLLFTLLTSGLRGVLQELSLALPPAWAARCRCRSRFHLLSFLGTLLPAAGALLAVSYNETVCHIGASGIACPHLPQPELGAPQGGAFVLLAVPFSYPSTRVRGLTVWTVVFTHPRICSSCLWNELYLSDLSARIIKTKQWCDMLPCLEGEGCDLLINRSGWTCTQPGGRIKTTTVS